MENIVFRGKKVGEVIGDVFITYRKPQHYFRKYQGFGISEVVINILSEKNVSTVRIIYQGKESINYNIPLKEYIKSNLIWTDIDDDVQKFVKIPKTNNCNQKNQKIKQLSLNQQLL